MLRAKQPTKDCGSMQKATTNYEKGGKIQTNLLGLRRKGEVVLEDRNLQPTGNRYPTKLWPPMHAKSMLFLPWSTTAGSFTTSGSLITLWVSPGAAEFPGCCRMLQVAFLTLASECPVAQPGYLLCSSKQLVNYEPVNINEPLSESACELRLFCPYCGGLQLHQANVCRDFVPCLDLTHIARDLARSKTKWWHADDFSKMKTYHIRPFNQQNSSKMAQSLHLRKTLTVTHSAFGELFHGNRRPRHNVGGIDLAPSATP